MEKWESTWYFGNYEMGWYAEKIYKNIPIHILIGSAFTFIPFFVGANWINMTTIYFRLSCFILSIGVGLCIEITQMMKDGFTWEKRHEKLFGSVRDIVSYCFASWIVFIL